MQHKTPYFSTRLQTWDNLNKAGKNSLHKTGKKLQKKTKVDKRWPKQSPDVDKIFTPWNFCPGIFIQMTVDSYFVGIALSFVLMRISKSHLRVSTRVYQLTSKILPWSGWGEGAVEGREGTWGERQEEEDQHVRVEAGVELRSSVRTQKRGRTQKLSVSWSAGDKLITDSLFRREHKIQWVQYM